MVRGKQTEPRCSECGDSPSRNKALHVDTDYIAVEIMEAIHKRDARKLSRHLKQLLELWSPGG